MLKVIVNKTFEFEVNSFQERYDGIDKFQTLTLEKIGVDETFLAQWREFGDRNPAISSIEFFVGEQCIISYSSYNIFKDAYIRSMPDAVTLTGTVTFEQR